jgi:hypothetical protein
LPSLSFNAFKYLSFSPKIMFLLYHKITIVLTTFDLLIALI